MSALTKSKFHFLCILFIFGISLSGCDSSEKQVEEVSKPVELITLSDSNVSQFTEEMAKNYITLRNSLLTEFKAYRTAEDPYGFTKYRNHTWTPLYIEKKDYYQAVLKKNRSYIDASMIKPLFLNFENLIYLGINLKNGLLDDNQELIASTIVDIKSDQRTLNTILEQL